ncbi:hypothetical protein [Pseudochryseolinea flava]|uniref:Uncharacterized protein n=1 Tax=Pseudochryseolinea flava TaxID=2059302 RepID=A0A364XWP6_9BACT|nr:hypothetical protein [Pseudochryseolinea flava]RAV97953.1 hypothetical protein DQQ10_26135 [Pseudochryseolinea flava]
MKIAILLISVFCFQQSAPFKPNDQFAINLDFQFKTRYVNSSVVEVGGNEPRSTTGGVLPYLILNVNVLKLEAGEIRVRVEDSRGQVVFSRKAENGMIAKLDLGFTDDIKDGVSSRQYEVNFVSKEKTTLSRILIAFEADGTYLVNGEKRGKI